MFLTIGESTTGVLGGDSAGKQSKNPPAGKANVWAPAQARNRRSVPRTAPAKGITAEPQLGGLITSLPNEPTQHNPTTAVTSSFPCRHLSIYGAVSTLQKNYFSTAGRSRAPSSISGCGGLWRYRGFKETLSLMPVVGKTSYKPGETAGMW